VTRTAAEQRLAEYRGDCPSQPLTARRLAGLLDVPGCVRRQVLDAIGAPLDPLAELLGAPPGGQSPFAIIRAQRFEERVTTGDMGPLLMLLRERLGAPVTAVRECDLSAEQVRTQYQRSDDTFRARLSEQYLEQMLDGDKTAVNLLRRPVLTLTLGGEPTFVEPDLVAYTTTDQLHPVEIRSYPCIDGIADPGQVSVTAREIAVHVIAAQEVAHRLGRGRERVATRGLLALPRNFTLDATGQPLDVAPQVRRLRRILAGFPARTALARHVPEGTSLPAPPPRDAPEAVRAAAAEQAAEALGALPSRFGDNCLSCGLFTFCRNEQQAAGAVARLGNAASNLCGDVSTVTAALDLAEGRRAPTTGAEQAVADALSRAATALTWQECR